MVRLITKEVAVPVYVESRRNFAWLINTAAVRDKKGHNKNTTYPAVSCATFAAIVALDVPSMTIHR